MQVMFVLFFRLTRNVVKKIVKFCPMFPHKLRKQTKLITLVTSDSKRPKAWTKTVPPGWLHHNLPGNGSFISGFFIAVWSPPPPPRSYALHTCVTKITNISSHQVRAYFRINTMISYISVLRRIHKYAYDGIFHIFWKYDKIRPDVL